MKGHDKLYAFILMCFLHLLNQVWGYESFPCTRTIDAHIAMLRKKIETNPEAPEMIITIHGKGYKFL